MKSITQNHLKLAAYCLIGGLLASHPILAQEDANDDLFELSPFVVETDDDVGYLATTTLAGSRIRTQLRDVGASLAIVTPEFLQDTGATDIESLLVYTGNTEVSGVFGNYSGLNNSVTGDANDTRISPGEDGQRIRGLVSAARTRDYIQTIIPFDSYNTGRVVINRGPNSILYGLGTPGGVINNSLSKAQFGGDFSEISLRVDQNSSLRATMDFNREIIRDRFALRVSVLSDSHKYGQEPAYKNDKRIYAAWNVAVRKHNPDSWLGSTTIRGNLESGEINRNPPDVIPPLDLYSAWWRGYEDPETLLQIPGFDGINTLSPRLVTEEQVLDFIQKGLVTVPDGMTAEEYADERGDFVPKLINDYLDRNVRNGTSSRSPLFIHVPLIYGDMNTPDVIGWPDTPELAGIAGIMGRWRPNGYGGPLDWQWSSNEYINYTGFRTRSLQDRNVFDYRNHLFQGNSNYIYEEIESYNLVLEQNFFNNRVGVELVYDFQEYEQDRRLPFSAGDSKAVSIDISNNVPSGPFSNPNENLAVEQALANPNLGRPVIRVDDFPYRSRFWEQETIRATVFGTFDFNDFGPSWGKWLGSHTVTGLYEDRTTDDNHMDDFLIWDSDDGGVDPASSRIHNGQNDNFRRNVHVFAYVGDDQRNSASPGDMRLQQINIEMPQPGDRYQVIVWDHGLKYPTQREYFALRHPRNADFDRKIIKSKAVSYNGRFLDNHLVAMVALRNDEITDYDRWPDNVNVSGDPDALPLRTSEGDINPELLRLDPEPSSITDDDTLTKSLVGYFPEKYLFELPFGIDLSAHYYEAESFNPSGTANNILNQPLADPTGETQEHGFTLSMLDNRLSLRVNWYETTSTNTRTNLGSGAGGPVIENVVGVFEFWLIRITEAEESGLDFANTNGDLIGATNYQEYYDAIIDLVPDNIQEIWNFQVKPDPNEPGNLVVTQNSVAGLNSTFDFVSEGMEIDLVGSVTRNWNISLNIAKQETVRSNTAPIAGPLAFQIEQSLIGSPWAEMFDSPFQGETGNYLNRYRGRVINGLKTELANDGRVSPEQRKWRVNVTSRYKFSDGFLEGFTVGGSLRWQSESAIGYPFIVDEEGAQFPDLDNAFYGQEELNGDAFIRYSKKIWDGKIDWTIQLNIRNLYNGGGDDIPVVINPDGKVAIVRIPNERVYFLSNSFRF